jgi:glycosyltransferase involved in cell wall biosynthesis
LNFLLPEILRKDEMDIFWGTLQLLPFRKLSIPSVVNYHDLNFRSAPQTMTKWNYLQHKIMSRFTIKNADRIFCLSQNTYNEICEYRPKSQNKLRVIYPGANRPKYEPENLAYKDFLFTVGTLEPRKNISTLLNSYLQIKKENPSYPYNLIIAGRIGWGDSTLAKELQAKTYEPQGVIFLENPSDAALLYLYRNCKFFVFPSLHEGFGLPLIEAIVEDKPCIGSDIPVFREILQEPTDIFVPPLDINKWKEAILQMSERKEFKRTPPCSEWDWNWEKTASDIAREISNLWTNTTKESKTHVI